MHYERASLRQRLGALQNSVIAQIQSEILAFSPLGEHLAQKLLNPLRHSGKMGNHLWLSQQLMSLSSTRSWASRNRSDRINNISRMTLLGRRGRLNLRKADIHSWFIECGPGLLLSFGPTPRPVGVVQDTDRPIFLCRLPALRRRYISVAPDSIHRGRNGRPHESEARFDIAVDVVRPAVHVAEQLRGSEYAGAV